eukprot:g13086.t1
MVPIPSLRLVPDVPETKVLEFQKHGVVLLRGVLHEWVPYLKEAGLFLTNEGFWNFWTSSGGRTVGRLAAQLQGLEEIESEVRLIVDQLNVNPHQPMFTEPDTFHTDVGVISAVAREQDVVRCWIPLQKLKSGSGEEALGTLEFQVNGQRLRFDDVEEGDVVMFTPTIPHRVLFPPEGETYARDRPVIIASLHTSSGGQHEVAVPEFPRIFPECDQSEVQARADGRLYKDLERYFRLWGKPSTLLDEWMQKLEGHLELIENIMGHVGTDDVEGSQMIHEQFSACNELRPKLETAAEIVVDQDEYMLFLV